MVEKEKKRGEEENKEEVSAGNTGNQMPADGLDEKEPGEKSPSSADDLNSSPTSLKPEEEDFAAMMADYEHVLKDIEEGEIVKGVIVAITEEEVLVDVGYKSEGSININEFPDPSALEVGQEVEVYLDKKEDQDGVVVLSKEKADFFGKWEQIKDYYENDQIITGKILDVVKGGLAVDIGVRAFLPASQVSLRPTKDLEQHIGKSMDFKVVKLNKRRRNIVLSHKVVLAEAREEMKKKLVETLKEGQVVKGEVKNITDFGAFVDIGGLDGLLHLTDLSWGRITHPSEVVNIGDKIDVKVLSFDQERERVSLGLKQLTPHPWEKIGEKFNVGDVARGRIVSITDYGAFMELEKGIEGLIHISEMSWTKRIKHPTDILEIGDTVEAMILNIDKENERISLGLRQLEPNPWDSLEERYPVGKRFKGKVRNITDFGIFVEVEEGIDGLVHMSDISWTSRVQNPSEVFKKGQIVEVVVLGIDKINRRVSLGMKQLTEDPWSRVQEHLKVGVNVEGEVVKIANYGAIVRIPFGIEGLLHVSEIEERHIDNIAEVLKVNQRINLKIISVSTEERKISLSIREFEREKKEKGEDIDLLLMEEEPQQEEAAPGAEEIPDEAVKEEVKAEESDAEEEEPAKAEEPSPEKEEPAETEKPNAEEEEPAKAEEPSPEKEELAETEKPNAEEEEPAKAEEPDIENEEPAKAEEPAAEVIEEQAKAEEPSPEKEEPAETEKSDAEEEEPFKAEEPEVKEVKAERPKAEDVEAEKSEEKEAEGEAEKEEPPQEKDEDESEDK